MGPQNAGAVRALCGQAAPMPARRGELTTYRKLTQSGTMNRAEWTVVSVTSWFHDASLSYLKNPFRRPCFRGVKGIRTATFQSITFPSRPLMWRSREQSETWRKLFSSPYTPLRIPRACVKAQAVGRISWSPGAPCSDSGKQWVGRGASRYSKRPTVLA